MNLNARITSLERGSDREVGCPGCGLTGGSMEFEIVTGEHYDGPRHCAVCRRPVEFTLTIDSNAFGGSSEE